MKKDIEKLTVFDDITPLMAFHYRLAAGDPDAIIARNYLLSNFIGNADGNKRWFELYIND